MRYSCLSSEKTREYFRICVGSDSQSTVTTTNANNASCVSREVKPDSHSPNTNTKATRGTAGTVRSVRFTIAQTRYYYAGSQYSRSDGVDPARCYLGAKQHTGIRSGTPGSRLVSLASHRIPTRSHKHPYTCLLYTSRCV